MYCNNCGSNIDNNSSVCPNCGASINGSGVSGSPDNGGFLWGLLGCCIPVAGLVLYLVWKDTKPRTAKAAGIGALVSVGIVVIYYIIVLALGASMFYMN